MSSAHEGGEGAPEEKKGLTRLIRRATKVLRGKRASLVGLPSAPASPSTAAPATAAVHPPAAPAPAAAPLAAGDEPIRSAADHSKAQEEKARAIFAKWGLTLEPGDWTPPQAKAETQWVETTVRMRVHRQCHRCQTAFGKEKVCSRCAHTRCTKCPRFPVKRPKEPAGAAAVAAVVAVVPPVHDAAKARIQRPILMMQSKSGTDLVRKVPLHRVRRTCHKCQTLFVGRATQCESCHHLRCAQCPRSPPKLKKWPDGYPGDLPETYPLAERTLRNIRTRTRWECHACATIFMEHERVCRRCAHERCDDCVRHPPKHVKLPPDDAVLQALYDRLAGVTLSPAA